MSGPKRNPDKLNTIGVVVVGICGAVLVYVTIVALQAFYMNDTSEMQNTQDYGNQDATLKALRADQERNINTLAMNPGGANATYSIPIDKAIDKVVESAKVDPASLVPALRVKSDDPHVSDHPTIKPEFGRPKPLAPAAGSGAGSAAPPPANGSGAGSAGSGADAGSAAPASGSGSGSGSAAATGSGGAAIAPAVGSGAGPGSGTGGHAP